jgi:type I restriction enzyme S subunit
MRSNYRRIGDFIQEVKARNSFEKAERLLGINIDKFFMPSVANTIGTDLSVYKLVNKNQFACNRMHVGRDYRLPISISKFEEEFIVSPAYDVFQIKDESELDPDFLMMWFSRKEFDRNAWYYTDADVRGGLPWKSFCDMRIPIPSIDKQREIVKEYNVIQDRIKLNEALIRKLEETAQAIYRQWFVEGIDRENLPDGWTVGTLSEISTIVMGQSPEGESYNEIGQGCPLINGPVEFGEYFSIKAKWTTEPKKYCKKGDLIFCVRGSTVGKSVIADDRYAIGRGVCSISSKYQFHLIQLIKTNLNEILKDVTGSTFPNIDRDTLGNYPIVISSNEKLEEFEIMSKSFCEIIRIKARENQKLTELKELLLSKLATVEG